MASAIDKHVSHDRQEWGNKPQVIVSLGEAAVKSKSATEASDSQEFTVADSTDMSWLTCPSERVASDRVSAKDAADFSDLFR